MVKLGMGKEDERGGGDMIRKLGPVMVKCFRQVSLMTYFVDRFFLQDY